MKIKHWAGYGTIEAKKLLKRDEPNETTTLVIKLKGNHERGLIREDKYDISMWLIPKFEKRFERIDYRYLQMEIEHNGYEDHVEAVTYYLNYPTKEWKQLW